MNSADMFPILFSMIPSLLSFALAICTYVFTALGLYTMAKRRGINKPWLAWIPVVDVWILGSLSDQYRYVARGEVKSKRKVLLTLNIIIAAISFIIVIACITLVVQIIVGLINEFSNEEAILSALLTPALIIFVLMVPFVGLAIAQMIIRYMALYDVYTSCDPSNNTLFLVLSILINITEPFFLFFSRNKDLGMPPRRQPAPEYIPAPQYTEQPRPERDPWENTNETNYL